MTLTSSNCILYRLSLKMHEEIASYLDDDSSVKMRVAVVGAEHKSHLARAYVNGYAYAKPLIEKEIVDVSNLEKGFLRRIPERISKELILGITNRYKNQLHTINLIWNNKHSKKLYLNEINSILAQQPNLHSLSLSKYKKEKKGQNIKENRMLQWPVGLETLILDSFKYIDKDMIMSLPEYLTTLVLEDSYFDSKYIQHLPRQLTSLVLFEVKDDIRTFISLLPSSLMTLILKNAYNWMDEDIGILPKSLTTLALNIFGKIEVKYLTAACFSLLPSSLKKLSLYCCDELTIENIKALPICLRSFKLGSTFPIKAIPFLPSVLTELSLSCNSGVAFEFFPKGLTRLRCSNVNFNHQCISKLPITLTSLHLIHSIYYYEEEPIQFPPNLIDLNITGLRGSKIKFFILALPSTIRSLNLSKTSLSISNLPEIGVKDGITKLPRDLKVLDLTHMENLTLDELSQLPPGLTSLNLSEVSFEELVYREYSISILPKSLTEIGLSNYQYPELDEEMLKKVFPEMNFVWHVDPLSEYKKSF